MDYPVAQRFLIYLEETEAAIRCLEEWSAKGDPHEKDLFVVRFILL